MGIRYFYGSFCMRCFHALLFYSPCSMIFWFLENDGRWIRNLGMRWKRNIANVTRSDVWWKSIHNTCNIQAERKQYNGKRLTWHKKHTEVKLCFYVSSSFLFFHFLFCVVRIVCTNVFYLLLYCWQRRWVQKEFVLMWCVSHIPLWMEASLILLLWWKKNCKTRGKVRDDDKMMKWFRDDIWCIYCGRGKASSRSRTRTPCERVSMEKLLPPLHSLPSGQSVFPGFHYSLFSFFLPIHMLLFVFVSFSEEKNRQWLGDRKEKETTGS